jgi:hypothetical protein
MLLTVKSAKKNVAIYKPRVSIKILRVPKVKKFIGSNKSLIIGLRRISKIARIKATLNIVWGK